MRRPRDSQRSKVYAAEREVAHLCITRYTSLDEVRLLVSTILSDRWTRKTWPMAPFSISVANGMRTKAGNANAVFNLIRIHKQFMFKLNVIHEVAHILTPKYTDHGRHWARTMLQLSKRFIGVEYHDALREAFKKHRVKYTLPRTYSFEARRAMVNRGYALFDARRKKLHEKGILI